MVVFMFMMVNQLKDMLVMVETQMANPGDASQLGNLESAPVFFVITIAITLIMTRCERSWS